jgi:benzodiazapine receptor
LLGFVGLSLLAWVASAAIAAANMRGWYAALVSPLLVPNDTLLARSWGLLAFLYVAMALAAWQVWRRPLAAGRQRSAMNFWGWQLALGAAWPAVFFGLHLLMPALVLAAGLVACAALTLWRFAGLDRMAAFLLLPFFGFTVSVFYLNAGFWWLNH